MMHDNNATRESGIQATVFPNRSLPVLSRTALLASIIAFYALCPTNVVAQTAPPPAFGEDTKGKPAIPETDAQAADAETDTSSAAAKTGDDGEGEKSFADNLLGEATITESRRESGQVYLIELEHSSGSKQYIEENDSDGKLSADGTDPEDEPILPKWKLGSW